MANVSEKECSVSSSILWGPGTRYYINDVILSAVNVLSALFALLGNLVITVAMAKKKLIERPCDVLKFSLTLLDCASTLTAKPLYIALRLVLHCDHVTCDALRSLTKATETAFLFCVGCSFTHMVLIAGDRCIALCKPLAYRAPHAKTVASWIAVIFWIIWFLFVIFLQWIIPAHVEIYFRISTATVLLSSLVILKVKTFLMILHYNRSVISDINSLDVQRLIMRERMVLVDARITLVTFVLLLIPTVVLSSLRPTGIYGNAVFPWSVTITLLISAINPVIHFWHNRKLRRSVTQVMRPCIYPT